MDETKSTITVYVPANVPHATITNPKKLLEFLGTEDPPMYANLNDIPSNSTDFILRLEVTKIIQVQTRVVMKEFDIADIESI